MQLTGSKGFLQSKTIWGGLIALGGAGLGLLGYTISPADQLAATNALSSIAAAAGGLFAIYGRVVATERVSR